MGSKIPHCVLLNDWIHQGPYLDSQVGNILRARLAVSVPHDVHRGLVPPVQHHHCEDMPDLVAGSEVVQLSWKVAFRNFGNVEQESKKSNHVHHNDSGRKVLYNRGADSSIEPNPVEGRDHSIARNRTEYDRAEPLPLLSEVTGMNLREEHCEDHCKHGNQIHLTPILEGKESSDLGFCIEHYRLYLLGLNV